MTQSCGCIHKNIQYLMVEAGVRYWEDARVNGVEDEAGDLIPFRDGDLWKPVIDLDTGRILDWPEGTKAEIHYKVCDAGKYFLGDADKNKVFKWGGYYVPDNLLAGGEGYGDYIIMEVDGSGQINGWSMPELSSEDWRLTTQSNA